MVDMYTLNADQPSYTPARRAQVKGKFVYNKIPGATMRFSYGYQEEKPEIYDFIDQHVYEISLALAKHLNRPYNDTRPWSFQSVDFIDIDALLQKVI